MFKQYVQSYLMKGLCLSLLFGWLLLFGTPANGQNVTLNGSVYVDVDSNCTNGSRDVSPSSDSLALYLLDNSSTIIDTTYTNPAGDYAFTVNTNNNSTVKVRLTDTGDYLHYCQSPTKTVNNPGSADVDFGLTRPSGSFAQDLFISGANSGDCIEPNQFDTFSLSVDQNATGPIAYKFNFDDGTGYSQTRFARRNNAGNFSIGTVNEYLSTGTYTVIAYAYDGDGNADVAKLTLTVSNSCKTLSGNVYTDTNNNCTFNAYEDGVKNRNVQLKDDTDTLLGVTSTDKNGQYDFNVTAGQNYKVVFKDTGKLTYGCTGNGVQNVTNVPANDINFGLNCTGTDYGVDDASIQNSAFRIGFARDLNFSVQTVAACNEDTLSGIEVVLDSALHTADSLYPSNPSHPKFTSINGDTVKYNLKQNKATDFSNVNLPLYTSTNASIGDTLCARINLKTNGDIDASNDKRTLCQNVVNAFDPNNKVVTPTGTDSLGFIQDSTTFTYTINYQNTGNATAVNAKVIDTLDKDLDPNTVNVINSSDNPSLTISQNRVLEFDFQNINLPDSGSNRSGSKGFITFEVSPKAGVGPDTQFTNYADIIFDQNPAIRTDTTINTICSPIGDTVDITACNEYVIPGDGRIVTSNGVYFDSFTAVNGCDSVVRINLDVISSGRSFIRDTGTCEYIVPSQTDTVYSEGIYTDTLPNASANGCDSLIDISIEIKDTARDTLSVTACSSYTVPSGDETYTNSGQYKDTVIDQNGCNRISTINLTIQDFASKTVGVSTCQSYEVPSGDETYTSSGQYNDTIPGQGGCDTVLTINLNIKQEIRSNVSRSVCDSFVVPSGDEKYFASGTYRDTISSVEGCDSVITFDLQINEERQNVIDVTTCGSYTVPSKDETYTSPGTYTDTVPTFAGCDSILTINLSFDNQVTSSISLSSCGPYTVPSGDETYTSSGNYEDTVQSVDGCDSIINIDLSVNQDKQRNISIQGCNSYTVPSGDETYTTEGTYRDTIPTVAGCDSVLIIDLTLGSLDTSVSVSGKTLIANSQSASYQWLICDSTGLKPIDGSSSKRFQPFKSASYAVALEQGDCKDTSACYEVNNVGLEDKGKAKGLKVYPNPATDELNIQTPTNTDRLSLITLTGQRVKDRQVGKQGTTSMDLSGLSDGVYLLKIYGKDGIDTKKVILK